MLQCPQTANVDLCYLPIPKKGDLVDTLVFPARGCVALPVSPLPLDEANLPFVQAISLISVPRAGFAPGGSTWAIR